MSEIFYSQIDRALEAELNARGRAGKTDRSTAAMNYMLGKIANVEIIAYKSDKRIISEQINSIGGAAVRGTDYLPKGFLTPTEIEVVNNDIDFTATNYVKMSTETRLDQTNRIPPIITSADITIGDHSMGLLNKATINITIPNPERDLNWFESTWLRPGRVARIKFAHPDSAVINPNKLLQDSLPSMEKLKARYPEINSEIYDEFRKLNQVVFDGLITSFQLDYQQDMSVQVSLQLTGTSNVYTDISLLMNPEPTVKLPKVDTDNLASEPWATTPNFSSAGGLVFSAPIPIPATPPTTTAATGSNYIYRELLTNLDTIVFNTAEKSKQQELIDTGKPILKNLSTDTSIDDHWAIYGKPYETGSATFNRYITLGYLVDFINNTVISKFEKTQNVPAVICNTELCPGVYYEYIVSSDPEKLLLMSADITAGSNYYGSSTEQTVTYGEERIQYYSSFLEPTINFLDFANARSNPSKIFINLETIKQITDNLLKNGNMFKVSSFYEAISNLIQTTTGNAIKMKLITHPDPNELDSLLFYDVSKVVTPSTKTAVIPYDVPMFANHKNGTVIREFKFSSKIPDSVKTLSYVLNQNPDKISEDDIAPYINYMYQKVDVTRDLSVPGKIKFIINADAEDTANKLATSYDAIYQKYLAQLNEAKSAFSKNPTNTTNIATLQNALKKYIQYPTNKITSSNTLAAPIFPFDVEFTVDGINGFRYGDVLKFSGLPKRYQINTVFSVISVTHTVGNSGDWTTKVRCIMRPKLD